MKKLLLALTIGALFGCADTHTYAVRVFYCDGRNPEIIVVESRVYPSRWDIATHQQAVPKYAGRLNVCDIECLNMVK